jgi:hypothetical protein
VTIGILLQELFRSIYESGLNHLAMKVLNPSSDLYIGEQTNQIGQTDYVNLLNLSGLEKIL